MKKIFSLLLALALLVCMVGCDKNEYKPVESTADEARVMMRVRYEGSTFDVRYELYRAFYLTLREGYPEVLTDADRASLEDAVLDRIYHVYSTLALCEALDMSIYSTEVEEKIKEFITISVEGGYMDGTQIEGHKSYEDYLASLRELNMNYSTQELIFRYSIAKTMIDEHYRSESGIYSGFTREDVLAYYEDAATGRYLTLYLDASLFTQKRAEEIAESIAAQNGEDAVFAKMVNYSTLNLESLRAGQMISKNNLDPLTYSALSKVAATLAEGATSAPLYLSNSQNNGYMILYKAEKSEAHFEENYDAIVEEYVNEQAGVRLAEIYLSMKESVTLYPLYETLDRDTIRID